MYYLFTPQHIETKFEEVHIQLKQLLLLGKFREEINIELFC